MDDLESGEFSPVGDAVCWLGQVCPDCGAMIEEPLPATCWRCGNQVVDA